MFQLHTLFPQASQSLSPSSSHIHFVRHKRHRLQNTNWTSDINTLFLMLTFEVGHLLCILPWSSYTSNITTTTWNKKQKRKKPDSKKNPWWQNKWYNQNSDQETENLVLSLNAVGVCVCMYIYIYAIDWYKTEGANGEEKKSTKQTHKCTTPP